MEVATGNFPYRKWGSVFEQLCQVRAEEEITELANFSDNWLMFLLFVPLRQVVQGDPPRLDTSYNGMEFSKEFVEFVNTW